MADSPISRRKALAKAAQVLAAAGVTLAAVQTASAASKIPQKVAGYQDQPNGQHKCGICAHFAAPNSCQVVDGQISPDGWCKLFAPKM